jgi:hypothetical protein
MPVPRKPESLAIRYRRKCVPPSSVTVKETVPCRPHAGHQPTKWAALASTIVHGPEYESSERGPDSEVGLREEKLPGPPAVARSQAEVRLLARGDTAVEEDPNRASAAFDLPSHDAVARSSVDGLPTVVDDPLADDMDRTRRRYEHLWIMRRRAGRQEARARRRLGPAAARGAALVEPTRCAVHSGYGRL